MLLRRALVLGFPLRRPNLVVVYDGMATGRSRAYSGSRPDRTYPLSLWRAAGRRPRGALLAQARPAVDHPGIDAKGIDLGTRKGLAATRPFLILNAELVALVNDDLVARFAAFLSDHHRLIPRLTLLDNRGSSLVAGALTNGNARTDGTDAHADSGFFCSCDGRGERKAGYNDKKCGFHCSNPH